MDFAALVVRDGDGATASGRVVRDQFGDWFEPLVPIALPGFSPRRVRPPWRGSIRVAGANFDDGLWRRFERDGAVEGYATLTGRWTEGQLRVEHQILPGRQHPKSPGWTTPPCPPPPGGWPRRTWQPWERRARNLRFDLGDLRETGAAVAVTTFRPSQDQAVLVVAAADPAAVEARLRPQLGRLLCVVPSKWARTELEAVRSHLRGHHDDWNLYTWGGYSSAEDGQARITACLTRMLPEVAAWAAGLPAGILDLEPWLTRTQ